MTHPQPENNNPEGVSEKLPPIVDAGGVEIKQPEVAGDIKASNPSDLSIRANRKPKDYFMINNMKCPIPKCNKKTSHLLYFLVGEKLDIRSLYSMLCENHATQKLDYYNNNTNREAIMVSIDSINKRTQEWIDNNNNKKQQ